MSPGRFGSFTIIGNTDVTLTDAFGVFLNYVYNSFILSIGPISNALLDILYGKVIWDGIFLDRHEIVFG